MGQNYVNQYQNPAAVIHWYKYFDFEKYFYLFIFKLILDLSPIFLVTAGLR